MSPAGRADVAVWRTVGFETPTTGRSTSACISMPAAASALLLPESRTELTDETGGLMGGATLG